MRIEGRILFGRYQDISILSTEISEIFGSELHQDGYNFLHFYSLR